MKRQQIQQILTHTIPTYYTSTMKKSKQKIHDTLLLTTTIIIETANLSDSY